LESSRSFIHNTFNSDIEFKKLMWGIRKSTYKINLAEDIGREY